MEGRIIADILHGIQADEPTERADRVEVWLYYDGGARGNPGPSGAGCVLLERHAPTEPWLLVWWAATYLGTNGTNNTTEHTALAQGLEEAARRYGDQRITLDIIGDSMLTTRQLQDRVRTNDRKFIQTTHRSRTALLHLYNCRFHHTLRIGNKTADWLANYAMDNGTTTNSSTIGRAATLAIRTTLYPLIASDTAHTWTTTNRSTDTLSRVKTLIHTTGQPHGRPARKRPRPLPLTSPTRNTRPRQPM